jgi:peroxiredoxin
MSDELHVMAYPTHFLIDKKGNIVRALPDENQVAEALEKEIAK